MDRPSTVTEEQLVLFQQHLDFQKEELAEKAQRSRAEEAIESQRITADVAVHSKNIEHAGKVLSAQANDRTETRTFWSNQIGRICWIAIGLFCSITVICATAIFMGQTELVFDSIKSIASYLLAVISGAGIDRIWINRKKTGISSSVDSK